MWLLELIAPDRRDLATGSISLKSRLASLWLPSPLPPCTEIRILYLHQPVTISSCHVTDICHSAWHGADIQKPTLNQPVATFY